MVQSTSEVLLAEIKKKREKMIDSAVKSGFTSKATLQFSQELDELIYEYQCTFHHEMKTKKKDVDFLFNQKITLNSQKYFNKMEPINI